MLTLIEYKTNLDKLSSKEYALMPQVVYRYDTDGTVLYLENKSGVSLTKDINKAGQFTIKEATERMTDIVGERRRCIVSSDLGIVEQIINDFWINTPDKGNVY